MLEQVYETIRGILFYELPKNGDGNTVVYDRVIKQYLFGDQEVIPSQPAIVIKGSTSKPQKYGQNLYKLTHTLTIQTWLQSDNKEVAERVSQEMAREVFESLLPHKRIWVLVKCPICQKKMMSPLHFTIAHPTLFAPYVATVTTNLTNMWLETHPATDTIPTFIDSGIARRAYELLEDDVRNNVSVPNLDSASKDRILYYLSDRRHVVRLISNVDSTDIKPSDDAMGKQILHAAEFSIIFEELVKLVSYGPDNVPTDSYSGNSSGVVLDAMVGIPRFTATAHFNSVTPNVGP